MYLLQVQRCFSIGQHGCCSWQKPFDFDSQSSPTAVRLVLFKNSNGYPDRNYIEGIDIVYILEPKKKGNVIVDLAKYSVKVPLEGVFVGLEWLGVIDEATNKFKEDDTYSDTNIAYNLTEIQYPTFYRNRFSSNLWANMNEHFTSESFQGKKGNYLTPSFVLEVYK